VAFLLLAALIFSKAKTGFDDFDEVKERELLNPSYSYKEKNAGGCYAFFKTLPTFFDYKIKPQVVTKPFATTYKKDKELTSGNNLYILVTDSLLVTKQDVADMISYAESGNDLFLALHSPDSLLFAKLGLSMPRVYADKHVEQHFINPAFASDTIFSRDSIFGGSWFNVMDTSRTTILGTDEYHRPNLVKIKVDKGNFIVSLMPTTLINFFLMHKNNMKCLEKEMSYTEYSVNNVYWDEYYKYLTIRRSDGDFNEWQVLMRYPAMRWALILAILLMLIYILFEGKRRQRIIPDKAVLANNSLEFVNALGQLYYNQHDNVNLARKIIQQWLEFIRNRYYLSTSYLNDGFINTLSHKSGVPLGTVKVIIEQIHEIQLAEQISDESLKVFYKNIQAFYLNTK
jgi:hypothetical protein